MSADLLLLTPSLLLVGAVAGSYFERGLNAHMWKRHGYCPGCDRLSDDDQVDMRKPGESFCADCPDHEGCMQGIPCGLVKRVHAETEPACSCPTDAEIRAAIHHSHQQLTNGGTK